MKETAGGLCLLLMLATAMLAAPLSANQSVAFKRTVIASRYDMNKEVTLEGTVQSLVKKPAPGMMMGAHLMVSTAQGAVDAPIGTYLSAGRFATPFASGQAVTLRGMMTEINGRKVFLVRTIQTEGRTLTVRNDHGFLVYPGSKLLRGSSAGGAR